ncbi:hypothetical protein J6590_086013 [Homalodisca vitripennis]|nr:hypothetical protein J6590_086013 [Homalodisca vitripennis]
MDCDLLIPVYITVLSKPLSRIHSPNNAEFKRKITVIDECELELESPEHARLFNNNVHICIPSCTLYYARMMTCFCARWVNIKPLSLLVT